MEDDDANIVKSVVAGKQDDFRKLVERYHYSAERWAFRHVKNLSDAENIAQEAFVEAYFSLHTLREPDRFSKWLRSIVNNTAISWLRQRRPTVSFEEVSGVLSDGEVFEQYNSYEVSRPDDLLVQQERDSQLQAAIKSLPPVYRNVVTMFYFDSYSCKMIADHLGSSVTAVKSILHRARQHLKKEMRQNV